MTCPHCQLENPPQAAYCDCGYEFVVGSRSAGWRPAPRSAARRWLLVACLSPFAIGVLLLGVFLMLQASWKSVAKGARGERSFNIEVTRGLSELRVTLGKSAVSQVSFPYQWRGPAAERWLCGDRVVWLELEATSSVDSIVEEVPLLVVNDFAAGLLYAGKRGPQLPPQVVEIERTCAQR